MRQTGTSRRENNVSVIESTNERQVSAQFSIFKMNKLLGWKFNNLKYWKIFYLDNKRQIRYLLIEKMIENNNICDFKQIVFSTSRMRLSRHFIWIQYIPEHTLEMGKILLLLMFLYTYTGHGMKKTRKIWNGRIFTRRQAASLRIWQILSVFLWFHGGFIFFFFFFCCFCFFIRTGDEKDTGYLKWANIYKDASS